MTAGPPVHPRPRLKGKRSAAVGAPELPVTVPSDFPPPRPSTGSVDDDDEPEDEHDGENEASEREEHDDIELPEEFERDDEDRNASGE
jgi:hypothetical protein